MHCDIKSLFSLTNSLLCDTTIFCVVLCYKGAFRNICMWGGGEEAKPQVLFDAAKP